MAKEIDKWKITRLMDAFKGSLLWFWYLSGILVATVLWFFPIPQVKIQSFAFAGIFIIYTLLSVAISKIEALKNEFE